MFKFLLNLQKMRGVPMFDLIQLVGGLILALGYMPQIKQLLRTKSSRDINLATYVFLVVGIGCMEVYAINLVRNGSGTMFLITNSIALTLTVSILIIMMCLRRQVMCGNRSRKSPNDSSQSLQCISICWGDISEQKRNEIVKVLGDENNFDVFPIAVIPIPEEKAPQSSGGTGE